MMMKYHQQKLAEREVDDVSWQQVWRLQPQKRAGHQEKRQADHTYHYYQKGQQDRLTSGEDFVQQEVGFI